MNRFKKWLENRWVAYTVAACIAVAFFVFLNHLSPVISGLRSFFRAISPIFIGLILAYLLDPIAKFFGRTVFKGIKKEGRNRIASVTLAMICFLAAITLFLGILVPALINSVKDLITNADYYYNRIQMFIDYVNNLEIGIRLNLDAVIDSVRNLVNDTFERLTTDFTSFLSSIGSLGTRIVNWVIGIIMAAYFLIGKKYLLHGLNKLHRAIVTEERFRRNLAFWERCHAIFINFIGCDLLDALIVGSANAVFMTIAGIQNIALVSLVVGVTNLLPTFGPIAGAVIGALIILLSSAKHALWFLIFTIIIQIIDGYIIKPKLFGSSLGIPSVWILIAIIIGGKLFGVAGVVIAIPVAAVLAILYRERFLPWLEKRKQIKEERLKAERTSMLTEEEPAETMENPAEDQGDDNA